jgi:hypothetical protein
MVLALGSRCDDDDKRESELITLESCDLILNSRKGYCVNCFRMNERPHSSPLHLIHITIISEARPPPRSPSCLLLALPRGENAGVGLQAVCRSGFIHQCHKLSSPTSFSSQGMVSRFPRPSLIPKFASTRGPVTGTS